MLDKLEDKYDTIGIIGFGSIAQRHLDTLAALIPSCHFVIRTRQTSPRIPQQIKNRITITTNIDDLLTRKPKLTIIATPANEHAIEITKIIKTSELVLIEKPIAASVIDAKKIWSAAKTNFEKVVVGYNLRFTEGIEAIHRAMANNQIGRIYRFDMTVGQSVDQWRANRKYKHTASCQRSKGGGVLRELSHEIDMMQLLFGVPEHLTAIRGKAKFSELDVEDTAFIQGSFVSESPFNSKYESKMHVLGTVSMDFTRIDPVRNVVVQGTNGTLDWNLLTGRIMLKTQSKTSELLHKPNDISMSFTRMFTDIMEGKMDNACDVSQALETIKIIEMIEKSYPMIVLKT